MKIYFSIAALVLAVASVVTAAPAVVPGRAPSSNSTSSTEKNDNATPAPPEIVKILKQMGWLSSNYKSPKSGSSSLSSNSSSPNGGSANNSTHTFQKRADCNSITLLWFERHPGHLSRPDQDLFSEHAFTLMVSPDKYRDKIPPAYTEGVAPDYWDTRVSKDGKWKVGHSRDYTDGVVTLEANSHESRYDLTRIKHYVNREDGFEIITNEMWDCIYWY